MTKDELGIEMRAHIARKYRTMTAAAEAWGVSLAFVSAVVNGNKTANETMLDDMGLERIKRPETYRKKKAAKAEEVKA